MLLAAARISGDHLFEEDERIMNRAHSMDAMRSTAFQPKVITCRVSLLQMTEDGTPAEEWLSVRAAPDDRAFLIARLSNATHDGRQMCGE